MECPDWFKLVKKERIKSNPQFAHLSKKIIIINYSEYCNKSKRDIERRKKNKSQKERV